MDLRHLVFNHILRNGTGSYAFSAGRFAVVRGGRIVRDGRAAIGVARSAADGRGEHLDKTHAFYEKHGGKTILFARFLPIIRTFAPFVAGVGLMRYRLFVLFSALGSFVWIGSLTVAGYFFGNIPAVKNNLTLIIVGIIIISLLPALRELIRHQKRK